MPSIEHDATLRPMSSDTHLACEALFHRFSACIDRGHATEAIEVFADDAVFEVGGQTYAGREEILGFLRKREARTDRHTRHLGANFVLREVGDNRAEADALIVVFAGAAPSAGVTTPDVVSDVAMTFVRHPTSGWQVASRRHTRFAHADVLQSAGS